MSIKYGRIVALLLACFTMTGLTVSAGSIESNSYHSYQYNSKGTSTAAPAGYLATEQITGEGRQLKKPVGGNAKMFCDNSNPEHSLLVFSDGERIITTDSNMNIASVYENFRKADGGAYSIAAADSVALDRENGLIYLGFSNQGKLTAADMTGLVISEITAQTLAAQGFAPSACVSGGGKVYITDRSRPDGYYVFDGDISNIRFVGIPGAALKRVTYDSAGDVAYGVSENGIYSLDTNEKTVNFGGGISNISDFSYSGIDECFYILSGGKVFTCDSEGQTSPINVQNAANICFALSSEKLAVLNSGNFSVSLYNGSGKFIQTKNSISFELKEPADMLYHDNAVYILDSGNGRVIKTDSEIKNVETVYGAFISDGKPLDITGAQGIYIKDGRLYIADTNNGRVLISDFYGKVLTKLTMPKQLEDSVKVPFRATKLLLDDEDNLYVIVDSVNMGALLFNKDGEYISFFGSNNVTATADVLLNYVRKKFLTREQMQAIKHYTPITLANFDIDSNGFIYTVTQSDQSTVLSDFSQLLRKLNYQGKNIFNTDYGTLSFGDVENDRQYSITNTSFCDVDIDSNGFICTLDSSRGKVFQYSSDGQFMTVFGGLGDQLGLFKKPVAIENVGDKIYVLDSALGSVTVFNPTDYEKLLKTAVLSLNSNLPDESLKQWYEVLKYDTNNQYAYYGMGIAYSAKGEYKKAMESFKSANSNTEYSKAFREYRKIYARQNLWWILLIAAGVIVSVALVSKYLKKRMVAIHGTAYSPLETKRGLPIYVLFHPIDGFSQFRLRNMNSVPISLGIVAAFFFIRVISFFFTGFCFNENNPVDYDLLSSLAGTVLLFALFVVSTWAITTFLGGKGKLAEIIAVCAYSMTPYLASQLINTVLSNFLTLQEAAFISIIGFIGAFWSVLLLLMGMATIQEYSFMKTVLSVILTIIGMLVIALIIMLFFSLMQQSISFIYSLWYEIKLR